MYGVKGITKFVRLCLKARSSFLIVAPPEKGKSAIITHFEYPNSPDFQIINDITGHGIEEEILKIPHDKDFVFFLIPEFTVLQTRHKASFLRSIMLAVMEEGVKKVKKFGLTIERDKPIRIGIGTAITNYYYRKLEKEFTGTGLKSRLWIFNFDYEKEDEERVLDMLARRIPLKKIKVNVNNVKRKELSEGAIELLKMINKNWFFSSFRRMRELRNVAEVLDSPDDKIYKEDILKELLPLLVFANGYQPVKIKRTDAVYFIVKKRIYENLGEDTSEIEKELENYSPETIETANKSADVFLSTILLKEG